MDGPREYHTKWSKSGRERQIPYDITYMWNLKKWYKWTYLESRNRLTDIQNKFMVIWSLRITIQGAQIPAATRTVSPLGNKRQEFLKENREAHLVSKSFLWRVVTGRYVFFFFFLLQFIDSSSVFHLLSVKAHFCTVPQDAFLNR